MRVRWLAPLLTALLLALPLSARAEGEHHTPVADGGEDLQAYVEGASRLEGRILAPCCWNQTIDIHGSETSYQLRREIRQRLKAGESAEAIEASFVKRYGDKILAVPTGSPLSVVATLLALAFAAAGVGAYFVLRKWSRGQRPPAQDGTGSGKRDALDERLDRELAEIGE
jgi:cytochrome c-type biogenesis protein CcmH